MLLSSFVSFRAYEVDNLVKVFILNEITKELFEFDGFAARFLQLVYSNSSDDIIKKFVIDNGLSQEISSFVSELEECGILCSNKFALPSCVVDFSDFKSNDNFDAINDMNNWIFQHGFLPSLFLELTYACNLKCVHCFNNKDDQSSFIDFDTAKKIIDQAYDLGVYKITLSGGESTISRDFLEIARYVRSKKLQLIVYTNGLTFNNDELFEQLIKIYPHRIDISLYSMNPDIHDSITGIIGSFDKTVETIKKLKNANISVLIKCVVLSANFDTYKDVVQFAKDNSIPYILDDLFIDNINRNNSSVQITDEQIFALYTDKESDFFIKKSQNIPRTKAFYDSVCKGGTILLSVSPKLDVFPCTSFSLSLGSLKENSLADIFKSKHADSCLNQWRNTKISDLSDCYKYDYCKFCFYCPSRAFQEGKFLGKSNVLCRIAKAKKKADNYINETQC